MLTGYDMEALAFCEQWGEPFCVECAGKKWTPLACAKAERGLAATVELEVLTRYSLIEDAEERGADEADERLERFFYEHPAFGHLVGAENEDGQFESIGGVNARFAFWIARDHCEDCGKPLVGLKDLQGVGNWVRTAAS